MEHRYSAITQKSSTHGVFLLSSNGMDVLLRAGALQYRGIGMYFFSGGENSNLTEVITDYVSAIGTPALVPYWALGFHLCR
jgi:alpha-glucosidase